MLCQGESELLGLPWMEKELLFLFNVERRWCRDRGVGREPGELDPFPGATDFVHNIDWMG